MCCLPFNSASGGGGGGGYGGGKGDDDDGKGSGSDGKGKGDDGGKGGSGEIIRRRMGRGMAEHGLCMRPLHGQQSSRATCACLSTPTPF